MSDDSMEKLKQMVADEQTAKASTAKAVTTTKVKAIRDSLGKSVRGYTDAMLVKIEECPLRTDIANENKIPKSFIFVFCIAPSVCPGQADVPPSLSINVLCLLSWRY